MPVNIFTPNMPLKPNSLGFTQPLVLGNFGNYRENMEINHENVNLADFGKHKFLTMPQQSSTPATGATEGGLYSAAVSGRSVMFLQRESTLAEVGVTIYPGATAASTFAAFTNIIDLAALVDATHPNFWGVIEIRDVSGIAINSMAFVKVYKGSLGTIYSVSKIADFAALLGSSTFQTAASILQIKMQLASGAPIVARFTITSFYFPES